MRKSSLANKLFTIFEKKGLMFVFDVEVIDDIYEEESNDAVFDRDVDHSDDSHFVPEVIEIKVPSLWPHPS